ncbi:hypothetical protein J4732_14060 [Serratia marcescens]|uniref:Uncharacterized protein n=1 Tax=Serratia marcescens TaxID=615 RepID=A0A939NK66_SERMA|nr:hypothetical protein [Serratia marcescens]
MALLAALALTLPPLLMVWRQLPIGRRGRTMSGLLFLPFVFVILWAATLNSALAHGVLHQALLPGWPLLLRCRPPRSQASSGSSAMRSGGWLKATPPPQ